MGGKVTEVSSSAEFNRIIGASKLTVVDFFATWCGPCKAIAPELERMAASNPNVNFVKVDVDKSQVNYIIVFLTNLMIFDYRILHQLME